MSMKVSVMITSHGCPSMFFAYYGIRTTVKLMRRLGGAPLSAHNSL
jgi:hypothetical protein